MLNIIKSNNFFTPKQINEGIYHINRDIHDYSQVIYLLTFNKTCIIIKKNLKLNRQMKQYQHKSIIYSNIVGFIASFKYNRIKRNNLI